MTAVLGLLVGTSGGAVLAAGAASAGGASAPGTVLPGTSCPAFPADNVWNTPVTGLPVAAQSATWLRSMAASTTSVHPDFGPSGKPTKPYGIPWTVAAAGTPRTSIRFQYASESDPGPYPLTASTPVESGADRHALMVDPSASPTSSSCTLFETWHTHYRTGGRSRAGSGAIWDLTSDALRPAGETSADAAGLPILPGLADYDEATSGAMDHALRMTVSCTTTAYVWPARHEAGQANPDCPPMGARFRLDPAFSLPASSCDQVCQSVVAAMQAYGLIVADNGSNWFVQGRADTRWTAADVAGIKRIPASRFVAVDESCLMVSPDSGQARQPGTSAYGQACG